MDNIRISAMMNLITVLLVKFHSFPFLSKPWSAASLYWPAIRDLPLHVPAHLPHHWPSLDHHLVACPGHFQPQNNVFITVLLKMAAV